MSTRTDSYVILGQRFDYALFDDKDETLEPFRDNPPEGKAVVCDGMGGKFVVIGKVIAKTGAPRLKTLGIG